MCWTKENKGKLKWSAWPSCGRQQLTVKLQDTCLFRVLLYFERRTWEILKLQCKRLKKYQCPVPRHFVGQRTRTCTRHRAAHPANAADATNADAANAVWNLEGSMSLLETICINM